MRIAEVIGRVTLSRLHPSLRGGRFLVAVPLPLEAMTEGSRARGETLSFTTTWGRTRALIGVSEAARPPTLLARQRHRWTPSAPA